jgi:hypothetical protein
MIVDSISFVDISFVSMILMANSFTNIVMKVSGAMVLISMVMIDHNQLHMVAGTAKNLAKRTLCFDLLPSIFGMGSACPHFN